MTLILDAEFFNRNARVIVNVDSKEKLERVVNFLINCPDPLVYSDPGRHSHFFVVVTRPNQQGNYQLHVSKAGVNCLGWWMKNREWEKEGQSS